MQSRRPFIKRDGQWETLAKSGHLSNDRVTSLNERVKIGILRPSRQSVVSLGKSGRSSKKSLFSDWLSNKRVRARVSATRHEIRNSHLILNWCMKKSVWFHTAEIFMFFIARPLTISIIKINPDRLVRNPFIRFQQCQESRMNILTFLYIDWFEQRWKDKKEQTNDQGKPLYSEQDKVLADRMVRYWTNFAKESK